MGAGVSGKYGKKTKGRIEEFWDIKYKLGQGSFGTVRKCVRKKDGKEAAVKIIRKRDLKKKELKALGEEEGDLCLKVHHKHCVQLYDIFDTKHHLYLVMELCSGGELFDAICERNFGEKEAATVVREITEALIYIHGKGIIHQDLKPENLLFASKERKVIKVMDYGLAKFCDDGDYALQNICRTVHYTAPEALWWQKSNASDYWSLGVVLYVLLSGYLPFYHEERAITVRLVRSGKFDFDDEEWDNISDDAKELIRRLLELDVDKRITGPEILRHPFIKENDLLDLNQLFFELFLSKVCPEIYVNEFKGWISNESNTHPNYSPACAKNYATLLARCFVDESRPTLQEFQAIRLIEESFQKNLVLSNE